jgi:hypothetical protein
VNEPAADAATAVSETSGLATVGARVDGEIVAVTPEANPSTVKSTEPVNAFLVKLTVV